ncbi:glycoside hydrolase [Gramella jeungdoensis]|uniref:Glycoside hydrolase n=1 Tax=Gramella jeungdoensis TaxID=708091 RepID=A0ABT0Z657_9FLAO|nr:glycoside hydrolase [Gramella jeungdoensis]MCM8570895.1 glycoside hydrolase [Gramella jeungdoensis]
MALLKKYFKLLAFLTGVFLCSCQADLPLNSKKLNGLSLVASRDSLTQNHVAKIVDINSNAVALMPFAFMRDNNEPELYFNLERQWFGERVQGIEQAIELLHEKKLKVMLKPQIWIRNGQFTGDLNFKTENEWLAFENSYREYILLYASVASEYNVELFCIGTELFNFVNERPGFWKDLIAELRRTYKGKLVYAENWDKVDKTEIWKDLDYIGADAYFPLSEKISPTQEEIQKGWKQHKEMLKELSSTYRIPVMFTEYGYRSIDFALKEPWNSDRDISSVNHNIQAKALSVLYEEFWTENWFAGGFLWKWHQHEKAGGIENIGSLPKTNRPKR